MGSGIYVAHYLNDRISMEFQGPLLDGGPEYYGLMWLLFEMLGDAPEHRLSRVQIKGIAHQCFSNPERVKAFIASALEAGLFQEEGEWFWCDELNRRHSQSLDAMPFKKRKVQERIIDSVKRGGERQFPGDFEEFWAAYPRKDGKVKAYEQFAINVKNNCLVAEMMTAARNYAKSREGEDAQYTLMPSTFLGPSQRWKEFKEEKAKASPVAVQAPESRVCPVCGQVEGNGYINACKKCGFWLNDSGKPKEVESWKREYLGGTLVDAGTINLQELLKKKLQSRPAMMAAKRVSRETTF
ncbi:MAG: hypothetical protein ACYC2S_10000 [Spirochaetales bacterium]